MSTVDRAGNIHTAEGAPGAGQFAGRANHAPAGSLAVATSPRTFFVRTNVGVRRVLAQTELDAQAIVATNFPAERIIGMADPDVHVSAQAGPVVVSYDWVGEGVDGEYDPANPHDQPLLRLGVRLAGGETVGFDGGSWCTATPSTADPDLVCSRAVDVAAMLAAQVKGKEMVEDQVYLIERFLRRSADVPDPVISRPRTPEEIAAAYPQRESGVVMGYAVVKTASGRLATPTPFAHQDDAEYRLSMLNRGMIGGYEVRLIPITDPDGRLVREP